MANKQQIGAGTLIAGRYLLRHVLASGALCEVYLGDDTKLQRQIVAKVVPPAQKEAYRTALRATAPLAHPAMVLVLDTEERDGSYVIVEEYVSGDPLAAQLERGLSSSMALRLGLQLARLMAYTHRRGVVHGDLTPAAVLIEPTGTIRVNNFCLPPDRAYFARSADVEAQLARGVGFAEVTKGLPLPALGTPASDLRALGLLLARALTTVSPSGTIRPFGADVPTDLRELATRLVLRGHARPFTEMQEVLSTLELANAALGQRADDLQAIPPAMLRHRIYLEHGREPDSSAHAAGIDSIYTQETLRLAPSNPVTTGPLRPPPISGPLRPPPISGPLRTLSNMPQTPSTPGTGPLHAPRGPLLSTRSPNSVPLSDRPPLRPLAGLRVFVSHSHADNAFCKKLVDKLREAGGDIWFDEEELIRGELSDAIEREMESREHFVAILSEAAVNSKWVKREIQGAINLHDEGKLHSLVFVVAEPCRLPLFWREFKRIEGKGGSPLPANDAIARTLEALSKSRNEYKS